MAQKVQVVLVDDIDGGSADETVKFSIDGASYEIDLSSSNASELRAAVAPWLKAARKVSGRSVSRGRGANDIHLVVHRSCDCRVVERRAEFLAVTRIGVGQHDEEFAFHCAAASTDDRRGKGGANLPSASP